MSRPSRGFSVHKCAPTSTPTCPSAAVLDVEVNASDEWICSVTWSPNVAVVTLKLYGSINGGSPFVIDAQGPVNSGASFDINPESQGDPGDSLALWVQATDVPGCGDFVSNTVTNPIE